MKNKPVRIAKFVAISALFLSSNLSVAAQNVQEEQIFSAMRDEAQRALTTLKLPDVQSPYFVEYKVAVLREHQVKASFGALLRTTERQVNTLNVGVRVGNYDFDNTNYLDVALSFFGSSDDEEGYRNRMLPLQPDYALLRRELWLATDAAYKNAAEAYSKKQATLRNKLVLDTIPDFLKSAKQTHNARKAHPAFDTTYFQDVCKAVSGVFAGYPEISANEVGVEYIPTDIFYYNSEGTTYSKTEMFTGLEMVITGQCADGMPIAQTYTAFGVAPSDLPTKDSLLKAARALAERFRSQIKADVMETYSGPVLFEEQAAAEVFAQHFAPNMVAQRQPLSESGFAGTQRYAAFQNKIGGRVLPEFLSVQALPTTERRGKSPFIGAFDIDDEGLIPPAKIALVNEGYLRALLSSRTPTRRVRESNAHVRGGAPMLSVIEMTAKPAKTATTAELKKRMLKLCKDRELPYGIIIRKALNENILYTRIFSMTAGMYPVVRGEGGMTLLEVVKVFPDGKEVLVRGAELAGISAQSFKDIIAVGKEQHIYNYLASSVVSSFITGGSQFVPTTVIVPDLLFEDLEIRRTEQDFPKLPILPSPLTTSEK